MRSVAARCQWKSAASAHCCAAFTATGSGCSAGSSCCRLRSCAAQPATSQRMQLLCEQLPKQFRMQTEGHG